MHQLEHGSALRTIACAAAGLGNGESLSDDEIRLRAMLDALPAAVYTTDANGRITYFNAACVEFSGRTPVLGSDHWCVTWKLYHPDGTPMPHDACPMAIALKEGRAVRGAEAIAERPNGTRVWFTPYPTLLRDADGRVTGAINMLVDITERKAAEEAKARLAAIVESSDDAIISKDLNGVITSWNRGAMRLFGYTAREAIGQPITMLIPPERLNEEPGILERIRRGERIEHYETVRRHKNGALLDISLSVSPIADGHGRIVGASKIARDITEWRRAQERVRRAKEAAESANIAKDNFLATLSHELRTPLTPVLAILGDWERSSDLPDTMRDDIQVLRRNLDLEARLIDDLLDLTRIVRGKLRLDFEVVDVHRLIAAVVDMFRCDIRAKRLTLSARTDAPRHFVRADPGRLQQALWNLLRNAIKFTPEGGTIELSTCNDDHSRLQVVVRDSGVGIAKDALDRIFEPFDQGSDETVKQYGGLGLGLTITKTLLNMHNGMIDAQSDGPGRGATFIVTLPTVQHVTRSAGRSSSPAPLGCSDDDEGPRSFRLLLVEDHADTLRVLGRLLRHNGHEVTLAGSLREAVEALVREPFDMLLSDLDLPDGTGVDLIRQIRLEHGLDIPAVALTGFGMEDDIARCRQAGFDDHLTKPVNLVKLEQTIQRVGMARNAALVMPGALNDLTSST